MRALLLLAAVLVAGCDNQVICTCEPERGLKIATPAAKVNFDGFAETCLRFCGEP